MSALASARRAARIDAVCDPMLRSDKGPTGSVLSPAKLECLQLDVNISEGFALVGVPVILPKDVVSSLRVSIR